MTDMLATPAILIVCTGNICRSAMADVIVRARAAQRGIKVRVESAGISDEETGNPIDPRARRVLLAAGYQVPTHYARQVRPGELADYDLVLAMTQSHYQALYQIAQRAGSPSENIRMWREFDPNRPVSEPVGAGLDVADPWYGGAADFAETLAVIEAAADQVLAAVSE